jgi:hypothetical protein
MKGEFITVPITEIHKWPGWRLVKTVEEQTPTVVPLREGTGQVYNSFQQSSYVQAPTVTGFKEALGVVIKQYAILARDETSGIVAREEIIRGLQSKIRELEQNLVAADATMKNAQNAELKKTNEITRLEKDLAGEAKALSDTVIGAQTLVAQLEKLKAYFGTAQLEKALNEKIVSFKPAIGRKAAT